MELIPTDYRIEQDLNEHTYYVVRRCTNKFGYKWFVTMYDRVVFLSEKHMEWSDWPCDAYGYDTPEEAFEGWKRYIKTKS